jgi:hypothetical protein
MNDAVVNLLGMVGVSQDEAWEIALRPCPEFAERVKEHVPEEREQ